jgi:hypothetical protein
MKVRFALRRAALGALLLAMLTMAMTSAWAGCASPEPAASAEADPGPTFGAEVTIGVVGRGRVTSTPAGIDCPASCFSRIVLADPSVDGGDGGVSLVATATEGAHFASWTIEELDLGVRARGPSQCSPMTRKSATPSLAPSRIIDVPFGETTGTPPRGREEECAAFTTVPVAYALTAVFEEDFVDPGPGLDAGPNPGLPYLFASVGNGPAREIGVSSGYVYWRYENNGASGVAGGFIGASQAFALTAAFDSITLFDVDVHVAFQHASGQLEAIQGGTETVVTLGNAPPCAALASDATTVYCRSDGFGSSTLYAWPISGAANPKVVNALPSGRALAVDTQSFYFSDDQGGVQGDALIKSAPRGGDGGMPVSTELVSGQGSPRNLLVGSAYLFWLDDLGTGAYSARSASKTFFPNTGQTSLAGSSLRFIAASPFDGTYFLGNIGVDSSSIYRAFAGSSSSSMFLGGIPGLGGIATDGTYVYWTQSDGRVYRAPVNSFP